MKIMRFTQKIESAAAKIDFLYWLTSQYYKSVVGREIRLAKINSQDRILCIGGGNCPFSAILLHQKTGAKVTVIDNDFSCVRCAQNTVERLGLSENISVLYQDGNCPDFSVSEFSVVHFALQISPAQEVFDNLTRRVSPKTKLLIRRPKNALQNMYCRFAKIKSENCDCIKHTAACNIGSTLLYVKQETAA